MSSPISLHIEPITDLKIDIPSFKNEHNNSREDIPYKLHDPSEQGFKVKEGQKEKTFEGFMSPLSNLTLPPIRKEAAGISRKATKYAYLYPPKDLPDALNWDEIPSFNDIHEAESLRPSTGCSSVYRRSSIKKNIRESNKNYPRTDKDKYKHSLDKFDLNPMDTPYTRKYCIDDEAINDYETNKWKYHELNKESYLACFALQGAFVYFEEIKNDKGEKTGEFKVVSINVLCFGQEGTQFILPFDGPYEVPRRTVENLNSLKRFHVIPLEIYHEIGYVAKVQSLC